MNEKETMLTSILGCNRTDLYLNKQKLSEEQNKEFENMKIRFSNDEPLQYIVGHCDFMGTSLKVDNRVLIPRPETEIMVDSAIKKLAFKKEGMIRILDLGTGSGNIAITLAKAFKQVEVVSVDKSKAALEVAYQNALENDVLAKIKFVEEDMCIFLNQTVDDNKKFDLIISNPPYIKTSDLKTLPSNVLKEPHLALDGGLDGFDYISCIIQKAHQFMKPKGYLFVEMADDQSSLAQSLLENHEKYDKLEFIKDYCLVNRIFVVTHK